MPKFRVEVIIKNKPSLADPEGITIERDLINKGGYPNVRNVRTGKYIHLVIDSETPEEAQSTITEMVNKLRISNPVAHAVDIRVISEASEK